MPFNGIHNLRDSNESVKLKPWQLAEIKKCAQDPIYFINTYVYINTKDNGMQLFKTWPFQEEAIKRFLKYRFNINRWSRQVGKSTIVRGFILWHAMYHSDQLVAMLANKLSLAKEQLQLLRDSYIMLPYWLQPGVKLWNKLSIQFSNNTRIIVAASSPDGIRGFSPNLLYLDEFAFLRNSMADEFMASVFPSISSGKKTRVIITSCVTKDTMVFTPDGIKTVGDYVIDDGRVLGYEVPEYQVLGRYGMNTGHIMHNDGDAKETRIITTRYSEVETSLMHKFWSCRDGEYKIRRAHELKVGDYVMVKYGMNCWGNDRIDYDDTNEPRKHHLGKITNLTEDWAYFVGLYIAEGCARSDGWKQCVLTCGDNLSSILNKLNLEYRCHDGMHYHINKQPVWYLLEHLGFDLTRHAPQKIIPPRLLRLSKSCTAAMLRGMFDGDGCSTKTRKRLSYVSTSKRLIDQTRVLLANFGILCNVYHRYIKPTKKVKVSSEVWTIEINQQYMVDLYFDEIGFGFDRKRITRETQTQRKTRPSRYDYIPFAAPEIRRLKKEKVLTNNEFKLVGGICDKHDIHLNRKLILDIKSKLPEKVWSKYEVFRNAEPDCVWVPITEITKSFNKVYDFSLNDDNYNGYGETEWSHSVVHNLLVCQNTPQGLNHFYRMWEDAVDEKTASYHDLMSKYVRSTVMWNEVPGREAQWGIDEMARIGEQKFRQEYECEFIGSAVTLIDYKILQRLKPSKPLPMGQVPQDYQVRMFLKPESKQKMELNNWTYVASLDTGYGIRKDYHVLQILMAKSSTNLEQAFVMSSNTVTIEDFCARAYMALRGYGFPPLTIEYNGPGARSYGIMFDKLDYPSLVNYDNKLRGMWATNGIKQTAVMLLKLYVQRWYVKLHDEATITELMSFTELTKQTWGAGGGNHDDHVTSLYWAVYYAASQYFEGNQDEISFVNGLELAFTTLGTETNNALEFVQDVKARDEQAALGRMESANAVAAL